MNIIEKIALEEGFRGRMYKCPADKWTIGYGFNLEALDMPEEVAQFWLSVLVKDTEETLDMLGWYGGLNEARRLAVTDMAYQIGVRGLCGFRRMAACLADKDYETAAIELLDSKYARQTPARAKRNADIIRSGEV